MQQVTGNIWDYHKYTTITGWPEAAIVIPTNIGWKANGHNVMGAGLAKDAAKRFPDLTQRYGALCKLHGLNTPVLFMEDLALVLFPTKPLNLDAPNMSWQGSSDIHRVEQSLRELVDLQPSMNRPVYIPLVGCGNGRLRESAVLPLMEKYLQSNSFILVRQ
jgi:hypothetical protein